MNNNDSYLESLNLSRMATSLKRPVSSVPEVAVVERFNRKQS